MIWERKSMRIPNQSPSSTIDTSSYRTRHLITTCESDVLKESNQPNKKTSDGTSEVFSFFWSGQRGSAATLGSPARRGLATASPCVLLAAQGSGVRTPSQATQVACLSSNKKTRGISSLFVGAGNGVRTRDLLLGKETLYH